MNHNCNPLNAKHIRIITSFILSVILLMGCFSILSFAEKPALAGSGTEEDPFVVTNAEEFNDLIENTSDYDGKHIVLDADINLREIPEPHGMVGTPEHPFKGYFDGQGHRLLGDVLSSVNR